jgi:DNA-binding PadR family transcriptional regulator
MIDLRVDAGMLEEQILRVLYDGSASARECTAEITPHARLSDNRVSEIEDLLRELASRSYVVVENGLAATRYSLTPAGSERLAELAE